MRCMVSILLSHGALSGAFLVVLGLAISSCNAPNMTIRAESTAILAGGGYLGDSPLPVFTVGLGVKPDDDDSKADKAGKSADTAKAATKAATKGGVSKGPMIGEDMGFGVVGGFSAGEVVRSATRLLGIRESFDERSFIGHILKVNDMLATKDDSRTFSASVLNKRLKADGKIVSPSGAMPGDVAIVECPGKCGLGADDGVTAGVVESSNSDGMVVVAYSGGEVRRCIVGKSKAPGSSCRIHKVVGVGALANRTSGSASDGAQP